MAFLADLGKGAAEGILGKFGEIADEFYTSDEEREKAKREMAEIVSTRLQALVEQANVETKARQEVLMAELKQGDTYTKRARPSIVYGGLVFIALNYVIFPGAARCLALFNTLWATKLNEDKYEALLELSQPLADLPGPFWAAWGGIAGSWVIGRSMERGGMASKVMAKLAGVEGLDPAAKPARAWKGRE